MPYNIEICQICGNQKCKDYSNLQWYYICNMDLCEYCSTEHENKCMNSNFCVKSIYKNDTL